MNGRTCLFCFAWVEDAALQAHWNYHSERGEFTLTGHSKGEKDERAGTD